MKYKLSKFIDQCVLFIVLVIIGLQAAFRRGGRK